jgi:hypothetical protein
MASVGRRLRRHLVDDRVEQARAKHRELHPELVPGCSTCPHPPPKKERTA